MKMRIGSFMRRHQITKTMVIGFVVLLGVLTYAFVNGDWSGFNNVYLK